MRRITLARPGEKDVILVTNLCDAQAVPAADLLEVYLNRWGIERMFQQITEVFGLAHLDRYQAGRGDLPVRDVLVAVQPDPGGARGDRRGGRTGAEKVSGESCLRTCSGR